MSDYDSQVEAYSAFGEALEAAGEARGDGGDWRAHLREAATAGLAVFELAGTVESSVTDLDSGETSTFVDTSAANQWTYVRAVYAALAAGDEAALEGLLTVDPEALRSEQVEVSPALDAVAGALRVAFGVEPGEDVREGTFDPGEEGDRYWLAQLEALRALGDEARFERAVAEVEASERAYYGGGPESALLLPGLGLRALSERA